MAAEAPFSAAEFIKDLSAEQMEGVFFAILKEVLAHAEEYETLPLAEDDGPALAYLLTVKEYDTLREKYGFPLYRDGTDEMANRIPRSERDWFTTSEVKEWLDQEDAERGGEVAPPSTGERAAAER